MISFIMSVAIIFSLCMTDSSIKHYLSLPTYISVSKYLLGDFKLSDITITQIRTILMCCLLLCAHWIIATSAALWIDINY